MSYEVIILEEVDFQINHILDYIYKETNDKALVKSMSDIIYWACYSLKNFPYRFQICFENIRVLNVKSLRIFYEIFEDNKKVVIFKILWQSQDY